MRIVLLLFLLIINISFGQNKQVLFGFTDIPQSLLVNPGAQTKNDWFVGVPLASHIHAHVGMTGIALYDLFADKSTDFNSKLRHAVYSMDANDHFAINQQIELFTGGFAFGYFYDKKQYLSFGLYQETDVFMYFPKDYAILAYEGNQNNINRFFDVGHLNAKGELLSVFHVGYNKKVNKRLTLGIRGKIYSSIIHFSSTKNSGFFVTVQGENNIYRHLFNLDMELKTSGAASLLNDDNSDFSQDIKELRKRLLFGGNLGLGIDFGFTYQPNDAWTYAASLQDLGFIRHTKDVENYSLEGSYQFEGINPLFEEGELGQTAEEYWDEIKDEFEELFKIDTTYNKFTSWRPIKLNASVEYAFGEEHTEECNCLQDDSGYLNAVGAHLFVMNRPRLPQFAFTTYFYRRLFDQLNVKATYSIDSYSYTNLGLGISSKLGAINFYILATNLLKFKNLAKAQTASLQLGFNYIFKQDEN